MTAVSPSLAPAELEDAVASRREIGADHRLVESQRDRRPELRRQHARPLLPLQERALPTSPTQKRAEWGLAAIVNGTNVDDLGDYRPGLEAAKKPAS